MVSLASNSGATEQAVQQIHARDVRRRTRVMGGVCAGHGTKLEE